jgi:hypothetical protein
MTTEVDTNKTEIDKHIRQQTDSHRLVELEKEGRGSAEHSLLTLQATSMRAPEDSLLPVC